MIKMPGFINQNLLLQYLKDLRDRGAKVSFHCIYSDDKRNWKMIIFVQMKYLFKCNTSSNVIFVQL